MHLRRAFAFLFCPKTNFFVIFFRQIHITNNKSLILWCKAFSWHKVGGKDTVGDFALFYCTIFYH